MKPANKSKQEPTKSTAATGKKLKGFTDEEHAAMRERVKELKAGDEAGESMVLAKIAGMREPDRTMAKRVHTVIRASAPDLLPRLWYGMPAYGNKDGKIVCFFQDAQKFKSRYATLGFTDRAKLDEGSLWSVVFAVKKLTAVEEAKIAALVKRAAS